MRFWIFFLAFLTLASVGAEPLVETKFGAVNGLELSSGIYSFRAIPYAEPPVGPLRWCPPQTPKPWEGIRNGKQFAAPCPQLKSVLNIGGTEQSEDCLYLNVWTSHLTGKRPVIVWIHGGGFVVGSASQPLYDGAFFAENGVVLVSFNYRLGPFGYFAHPELEGTNFGVSDQTCALEWVRDNIACFGGDPDCVTIFGVSSGGDSVANQLISPRAKGLFHRAILQSANCSHQFVHHKRAFLGYLLRQKHLS